MSSPIAVRPEIPFLGLHYFDEENETIFFGREEQLRDLLAKLADSRFVTVIGSSGSGKSSLARAGLIPALRAGFLVAAGPHWQIVKIRPGSSPLVNLAQGMEHVFGATGVEVTLRRGPLGLVEAALQSGLGEHENLLIMVDQFEEIFRYQRETKNPQAAVEESSSFVKLLLEATSRVEPAIFVLITMRSDYLGACAQFRDLPERINIGLYLIPRMRRDQLEDAITGPAAVAGARFSPPLVQKLLNDAGEDPDQLPVLQHALLRAWLNWRRENNESQEIDFRHYDATGGVREGLDNHAEEIYGKLGEGDKKITEILFKCLTERDPSNNDIRRPCMLRESAAVANVSPDDVRRVADAFRAPGVSFLTPTSAVPLAEDTVLDITHESLLRKWKQLRGWVDAESKSAQLYRRVADSAERNAAGREGAWRDPQLQFALDERKAAAWNKSWAQRYRGNFEQAMVFLDDSQAQRDNEEREQAERQQREVEQAHALAEEQRKRAEERARAARRSRWLAAAAGILALAALLGSLFATYEEEKARKALAVAEEERKSAYTAEEDAEDNEGKAQYEEKKAQEALTVAKQQKAHAEHEARRNLSHELAGASTNLTPPDPGFSLLLALEAVKISSDNEETVEKEAEEALQRAVQSSQKRRFSSGHTGTVLAAAFSSDGKHLATAGWDGTARLWDLTTGLCVLTLTGHSGPVHAVAFGPDGKRLATAGEDKTVKLWDVDSGKELRSLPDSGPILAVSFSGNGKWLATGSKDGSAKVWDLAGSSGNPMTFRGHTDTVWAVAFSPNGKYLATASQDGDARIWSLDSPATTIPTFSGKPDTAVYAVAFSQNGQHLVTAGQDKLIRVWDTADPKKPPLETPSNHVGSVRAVAFSPDGKHLGTAGEDSVARIWDVSGLDGNGVTLGKSFPLSGHTNVVYSIAFSPDGLRVATASADSTSRVWDTQFGQELLELRDSSVKETVLAISSDGKLVAAAGNDKSVRLFDGVSGLELFTVLPNSTADKIRLAFSPDNRFMVVSTDKIARVWTTRDGREVRQFQVDGLPAALALNNGGTLLATMTARVLQVRESGTPNSPILNTTYSAYSPAIAFTSDGSSLAATTRDKVVTVWDLKSRAPLPLTHSDIVATLIFSPDGKRLVTASSDTVRFWDIKSGNELHSIQIQAYGVYRMALSPDGSTLATLSRLGTVKVWKVGKAEEELSIIADGLQKGGRLGFHPDGDLITASSDMVVREYPLTIEELLADARAHVERPWTIDECRHYLHGHLQNGHCPVQNEALSYVVEGNHFSVLGESGAATASFKKARDIDPTLRSDAAAQFKELWAEALLASGRRWASVGNWDDAQKDFRRAIALNPEFNFDPGQAARHLAVPALVARGQNLARAGDRDGAVLSLHQATEFDSALNLDPEKEAVNFAVGFLVGKGVTQATLGDIDGAVKSFREAQKLDPTPNPDRTNKEVNALRQAAASLAKSGDLDGTIKALLEARDFDSKLNFDPETEANRLMAIALVANARELVKQDNQFDEATDALKKAISVYSKFETLDPHGEIRANALNAFCWQASVRGHADKVVKGACDEAVALAPDNADIRDSRGVARALTKDFSGAIDDFQYFIDHANRPDDLKSQRKRYVDALRKGQDPFNPAELATLVNQ